MYIIVQYKNVESGKNKGITRILTNSQFNMDLIKTLSYVRCIYVSDGQRTDMWCNGKIRETHEQRRAKIWEKFESELKEEMIRENRVNLKIATMNVG